MLSNNEGLAAGQIQTAKIVTLIAFILNGFVLGSLIARIPDFKRILNLSNSQVGTSLLFIALGVFLALKPAGLLSAKYGSKAIILCGSILIIISCNLIGASNNLTVLRLALFALGYATATHDIAMNAHAVLIEKLTNQRMMGLFHANFSIGTLLGGIVGGIFSQVKLSISNQQLLISLIISALLLFIWDKYLPSNSDIHGMQKSAIKQRSPVIFWILGIFGLCAAMGEGAAGDWGGVLARDAFGASPFVSTIPYIAYSATMVIGRLSCDKLANRFGAENVIRAGGFISGFGLLVGLIFGGIYGVVFGWFCIGLGLSIVMPLIFSAAGRLAHEKYQDRVAPSVAVARVSGTAYFGFMIGPPVIGFLAEIFTLRWAMLLVVLLSSVMLFGGRYAKTN